MSRPFAKFCRHCRTSQPDETQQTPERSRWTAFAEFDRPWHFQSTSVSEAEARLVVDFHQQIPGYRHPNRLLSHLWFDGLLAIHQADAFAAIVHPFADRAQSTGHSAVCWSLPDHVNGGLNQASGDLRAFPPVLTPDQQYLLFSSPRGAFGIELATLPGWGITGHVREFRVLENADLNGIELAAAPIPLSPIPAVGVRPDSCLVGLLLRSEGQSAYQWRVVDLMDVGTLARPLHECHLPLQNSPAQVLSATSQAIVFATPSGHWWWSWRDAQHAVEENLHRSWHPPTDDDELLLDCHVETLGAFDWRRQHLISIEPVRQTMHGGGSIELCYARKGRPKTAPAEFYKITPSDVSSDHPIPLSSSGQLIPIGSDGADLLFLGNTEKQQDAQLWRRAFGENKASSLPGVVAQQITDVIGVQVRAPLMVLVCNDDADAAELPRFRVRVLRLDSSPNYEPVEIPGLHLIADPIVCAEYLFTIEQQDGGLQLIRRRLPIGPPL